LKKADHRLTLYADGEPVRSYDVELGSNWVAVKTHAGDSATPEGHYRVVVKKDRGESAYHRALLLNYPNDQDRQAFARARRRGLVPSSARPGGLIEIHGAGGRGDDWTNGCVAMSNSDIDDLFRRVPIGTRVTIVGGSGQTLFERTGNYKTDHSLMFYER
jgi:murein L,D-transpeptidase YafK